MNTNRITDRDAEALARGRVSARPELDPLADLLTTYRSTALGSAAPRPSAELAARLDLTATPIPMNGARAVEAERGKGARRTASGLFGLGVTATIILGAASGAAAVVGAGSAGLLPPGAQDAFDEVVSVIVQPGVAADDGSTHEGGAPGDDSGTDPAPGTFGEEVSNRAHQTEDKSGGSFGQQTAENATTGNGNGNGNNGNGNGNGGPVDGGTTTEPAPGNSGNAGNGNGNSGNGNGNSGNGNGNSGNGNGNSGNGNGNGGSVDEGVTTETAPGNSENSNGNSGNGNSGNGNGNAGNNGNSGNAGQGNNGNGNGNGKP